MFYSDNTSFWVTLFNLNYKFPINESNDKLAFGRGKLAFGRGKLDFEGSKLAFEAELKNIEVKKPTKDKIMEVYCAFGKETIFGRKEIAEILNISLTGAGDLIAKMFDAGLLEPVKGHGKGQYKFK